MDVGGLGSVGTSGTSRPTTTGSATRSAASTMSMSSVGGISYASTSRASGSATAAVRSSSSRATSTRYYPDVSLPSSAGSAPRPSSTGTPQVSQLKVGLITGFSVVGLIAACIGFMYYLRWCVGRKMRRTAKAIGKQRDLEGGARSSAMVQLLANMKDAEPPNRASAEERAPLASSSQRPMSPPPFYPPPSPPLPSETPAPPPAYARRDPLRKP